MYMLHVYTYVHDSLTSVMQLFSTEMTLGLILHVHFNNIFSYVLVLLQTLNAINVMNLIGQIYYELESKCKIRGHLVSNVHVRL